MANDPPRTSASASSLNSVLNGQTILYISVSIVIAISVLFIAICACSIYRRRVRRFRQGMDAFPYFSHRDPEKPSYYHAWVTAPTTESCLWSDIQPFSLQVKGSASKGQTKQSTSGFFHLKNSDDSDSTLNSSSGNYVEEKLETAVFIRMPSCRNEKTERAELNVGMTLVSCCSTGGKI